MRKLTTQKVCEMAGKLGGVTVKDHFGSDGLRAHGRMFATVWHESNEVNLMLSLEQQNYFVEKDGEGFSQIDNAWGRKGATNVQLAFVDPALFSEALKTAWEHSKMKRSGGKKKTARKVKRGKA